MKIVIFFKLVNFGIHSVLVLSFYFICCGYVFCSYFGLITIFGGLIIKNYEIALEKNLNPESTLEDADKYILDKNFFLNSYVTVSSGTLWKNVSYILVYCITYMKRSVDKIP